MKKIPLKPVFLNTVGFCLARLNLHCTEKAPAEFAIQGYDIHAPNMQADQSGLKVLVLSDLHVGSRFIDIQHVQNIVAQINQAEPDLVVMPGDFVNSSHGSLGSHEEHTLEDIAGVLAQIKAQKIASYGNHEYKNKRFSPEDFKRVFEVYDIPFLCNESLIVNTQKGDIQIAVLDDVSRGCSDYDAAFKGIQENMTTLFVTHSPDGFLDLKHSVALAIAGDTHGSQIDIWGWKPIASLCKHIKTVKRWNAGLYEDLPQGNQGFVSNGVGTTTFPIRMGCSCAGRNVNTAS